MANKRTTTLKSRLNTIALNQFVFGGISPSDYTGERYSFADFYNLDPFTIPNALKLLPAYKSLAQVNDDVRSMVKVGSTILLFGYTTGNIWTYDENTSTLTLAHTLSTSKYGGSNGILGAYKYGNYVYLFTQNAVHRIPTDGVNAISTNIEEDWEPLNVLLSNGDTSNTYTLPNAISETNATDRLEFTAEFDEMRYISVNFQTVPTSTATVYIEIHKEDGSDATTITEAGSNITTGWNVFNFSKKFERGHKYHLHIWSSDGTGVIYSSVNNDMLGANVRFHYEGDDTHKPAIEQNLILYVGDKNFVHQIRGTRLTHRALDIPSKYRITALGKYFTHLVIGTTIDRKTSPVEIFRWNTWSDSFDFADTVPEASVDAFVYVDNALLFVTYPSANVYQYVKSVGKKVKRLNIRTKSVGSWHYATGIWGSLPVFAVDNYGLYAMDVVQTNYPLTTIRMYDINGALIRAIVPSEPDMYFIAYDGTNSTLYKTDSTKYVPEGEIVTRFIDIDGGYQDVLTSVRVSYEGNLPSVDAIKVYYRTDPAGEWREIPSKNVPNRKYVEAVSKIRVPAFQIKVVLRSNGDQTPIVNGIYITGQ